MGRPIKRRCFLKATALGTVGLVIGCDTNGRVTKLDEHQPPDPGRRLVTWVRITSANLVYIAMQKAEMGQGVQTSLPLIVAEEMDLSMDQVRVEIVAEGAPYTLGGGLPMTYGSTSVSKSYMPFRRVGAGARAVLVQAAARRWGIAPSGVTTQNGACVAPDGSILTYSELVEAASSLEPPSDPPLKNPDTFQLIGTDQERLLDGDILDGRAVYGIDATPPGGLYAAIRHAPTQGGSPTNVDQLAVNDPAVRAVVALPNAVAVVADSFWSAHQAVSQLPVTFKTPETDRRVSTAAITEGLRAGLDEPGVVVEAVGDVEGALDGSLRTYTAEYHAPTIAHAPMEPVNATARVTPALCELWLPTQAPGLVRANAMQVTGLSDEQIVLHPTLLGGGFGRKANSDYSEAAIRIAREVDAPVTLIWSREEDIRRDRFRPSFAGRITGAVDARGRLTAWDAVNCGDSVLGFGPGDPLSAQGLSSLPYTIPHQRCRHVYRPSPITSGFWRSIGHSQNTFFVESFLDEMADLDGRDPVEFRLRMLDGRPRVKHCLERVAELGRWGDPTVRGAGQGVAVCDDYGSTVAVLCEASVDDRTRALQVHRWSAVVDCGVVIQPDGVRAQIEGGLLFGLGAALHEEITFQEGRTLQSNLHDYRILAPSESPEVVVEIVDSAEDPGGVGELSVGPAAPALANAIYAASGIRVRSLPFDRHLPEAP